MKKEVKQIEGMCPTNKKNTYHESVCEAITQALLLLMEHQSYERITVMDIIRKAGVGRSSFYRNFHDKDEILEKYVSRLFSGSARIHDPYSNEHLRETIISHYQTYYENRDFLLTLHRNKILYRFLDLLRNITESTITDNRLIINAYQPAFFSAANLGVLGNWLERGCQESPEEIAEVIITLLFHTPKRDC